MVSVPPLANALAVNFNGCNFNCFSLHASTALVGLGLPILEVSRLHSVTPRSVELLWKRDRPVAETST